jgi:cellulose synthase/poly-beta-1,6-N-acetylglucosamine synthase-like glycosyltransferase
MARPSNQYQFLTDRRWFQRSLEIFPGFISWTFLITPIVLSFFQPLWVAYFIIAFDLIWLIKAFRITGFLVRGYNRLNRSEKVDWAERLDWLRDPDSHKKLAERRMRDLLGRSPNAGRLFHTSDAGFKNRRRYKEIQSEIDTLRNIEKRHSAILPPDELFHLVILAVYNEPRDIIEPSVRALLEVDYPTKQLMLVIAYEERGGEQTKQISEDLIALYGHRFAYAEAIMHPDGIAGEVRGKGGNITWAGRQASAEITERGIDAENVVVTTFDSDHRAGRQYFSYLSYAYCSNPNRIRKSYQPVPMFYNNIWDAPAPMRVIATNNSFWLLVETMRPHRLRNFAAHAQSLKALQETDFWSVTSIVEDGHQYWRSYFAFDGDHQVVPMYVPVYQDAVLAESYLKTFKAQYLQLRRWAWGITDFSYVVTNSIRNHRISWAHKIIQIWRLFEGHFSWATAALTIAYVAWLPLFLNEKFSRYELAHQLPIIASRIQNVALIALIITVAISMRSLPPRPARYSHRRSIAMVLQWALLPIISIGFSSLAAIDAQTRLMFGRYLGFDVTTKRTKKSKSKTLAQASQESQNDLEIAAEDAAEPVEPRS